MSLARALVVVAHVYALILLLLRSRSFVKSASEVPNGIKKMWKRHHPLYIYDLKNEFCFAFCFACKQKNHPKSPKKFLKRVVVAFKKLSLILHINEEARAPLRDTRKKRQRNISGSMSSSSSDVRVVEATNAPAFEFGHAAGITVAKVLSPSNFKNDTNTQLLLQRERRAVHVATCGNDGYVVVRDLSTKETIAQLSSSSSSSKEKKATDEEEEEEQKPINADGDVPGTNISPSRRTITR